MAKMKQDEPGKVEKTRITTYLPVDLIDRVRDAVFWTPGMTVAQFMEDACTAYLQKLEKARGGPFEARTAQVKRGRPVG